MIRTHKDGLGAIVYVVLVALCCFVLMLCVSLGSVNIPLRDTAAAIFVALKGERIEGMAGTIILSVRLPRILAVALTGAALSLCGAAMQGLLRNPLAEGSTLGVSSGASLGAMLAILFGISIPSFPLGGTMIMAMLCAFLSLAVILSLAYALDHALSTNTIILIGVIFSMFASSLMNLLIAFAGEKLRTITFWTMGSLAGCDYTDVLVLLLALMLFGGLLLSRANELNAFAIGEENARHIGVNVRLNKLIVMVCASALIGVCVSVGGTIGFVGLVVPHIARMIVGPNHKKLLPVCVLGGAMFLMLCDLAARMLLSPIELPIGVVTSLIGAVVFTIVFYRSRKAGRGAC